MLRRKNLPKECVVDALYVLRAETRAGEPEANRWLVAETRCVNDRNVNVAMKNGVRERKTPRTTQKNLEAQYEVHYVPH